MYELDCAYIQSTGRVYRDQQVFIIGYLAGNDDLLLVTAREATNLNVDAGGLRVRSFSTYCWATARSFLVATTEAFVK